MVTCAIENLLGFALDNGLIMKEDVPYCRNTLLDLFSLSEPQEGYNLFRPRESEPAETSARYLDELCDYAYEKGILTVNTQNFRGLFSARIMGILTLPPSSLQILFDKKREEQGIKAATDWFYHYCLTCNYIQVDAMRKNVLFRGQSKYGELDITINLSKPEKNPKDIALAANLPKSGYPACLLCVENTGHSGDALRPARQNHRMLPITLAGESWHFQYSPYLYYNEHCIALSDAHSPMKMCRKTFERLLDFIDLFPHYFIGSNAGLPIVGGSILAHEHFQGGNYVFPMDRAADEMGLALPETGIFTDITASLAAWPMTCIRLRSANKSSLIEAASRLFAFWQDYSDESVGVLAQTDTPHNAVTPIARKQGDQYLLSFVLRNNRTDAQHPFGIFHPNEKLHHIKKENIGLIEVMGLFILPGRLKTELKQIEDILTGKASADTCPEVHRQWLGELMEKYEGVDPAEAETVIRMEVCLKCENVLEDAGVFKCDQTGRKAFVRFWNAFSASIR